MNLLLKKSDGYDRDFLEFLLTWIQHEIDSKSFNKKGKKYTKMLKDLKINLSISSIIRLAGKNFQIVEDEDNFIIQMNHNKKIHGIRLFDICRIINYGNDELSPWPLFSDVLHQIEDNVTELYMVYAMGLNIKG